MKYLSGEEVVTGDLVFIENGKTKGAIHSVIETREQMEEWGLDEPGVMIESEPFGLVFWPQSEVDDPVVFSSRS